ncbi:hypothetical protein [Paraliomyxa miuraensis]|uniref:hypothetical protein n=1 Tax=Paraliomyxa miuraensis TaxID=376150 RepID=UPI00224D8C19|nr:hypothetical protein [Paraliomyxa miuraensis]MCX4241586.1 hypothetical protein [Paraliomyxa miuraensis]
MDVPTPAPAPDRPRTRRLVLGVIAVIVLLCVVFGITVRRQQARYQEYRAATLEAGPLPWTERTMSPQECVAFTVDWAMACPGVESWCANEAPRLTRECLSSTDRSEYCESLGDEVASTHFGYAECETMRQSVEGRYTKRNHKKFCASSYRAVAEYCRSSPTP